MHDISFFTGLQFHDQKIPVQSLNNKLLKVSHLQAVHGQINILFLATNELIGANSKQFLDAFVEKYWCNVHTFF